ncbi:Halomucin [Frankliniella fusca]|uniref:Halomucin n=1 Tax=Frankliniella fusca TaxID=407009 RepID=A0AAE1L9N8_9NEOP|nr:Halomucin [Frankliniella fusca]
MEKLLRRQIHNRAVVQAARQARFDVLRLKVGRAAGVDPSSESDGNEGDVDSDVESNDEIEHGRDGGDERHENGDELNFDPGNVGNGEDQGSDDGNDEFNGHETSGEDNGTDSDNEFYNTSDDSNDEGEVVHPQDVQFEDDNAREQYIINSIREWALRPGVLSMTKLDDLLHSLKAALPNIPLSYKTLLQCDYENDIAITDLPSGGQMWYKSIKANLDSLDLREYLLKYRKIIIDVNMDGLPLSKSSQLKFWPILGHFIHTDNEPFIIAVYCGTHDPKSVNEYLEKYVNEVVNFPQHGYESFIKCIIAHNGYCSCEKCTVLGEYTDRMTFVDLNAPLRTDISFSQRAQPRHHTGVSPLERFGEMVSSFRLDPMHLLYQGVMKRILNHWLHVVGQWKIPVAIQDLISEVFEHVSSYCPCDFNRRPRSLNDFADPAKLLPRERPASAPRAPRENTNENYIGDGDSKTYKALVESDPYRDKKLVVKKRECTAHVQKRMGTRLRNLKKELSGKKLSDGKPLAGKGWLTDKIIDQIAQYYGKAIRSSKTVTEMKTKVWAIYYHMSATDAKPTHQFCPKGATSWCKYQKAVAARKGKQFTHKPGVPLACMEACRKVFEDLTSPDLLERCIGGYTQNPNESVNNLMWLGCPEVRFFGKKTVDIAAAEGILQFNDGCRSKIKVMREMGVEPGINCINWAISEDSGRVVQAQLRAKEATKEARVARLQKRRVLQEACQDNSYVPGGH